MDHPLVLIGPMGAGKSTVGSLLADSLEVPHYDSDTELVKEYGAIDVIFSEQGEGKFRQLEYDCVKRLLDRQGGSVVSLGGGAPLSLQEELSKHVVVYLEATWSDVAGRLTDKGFRDRPLLAQEHSREAGTRWKSLLAERRPSYERLATATVAVGSKSPENIVVEIVGFIRCVGRGGIDPTARGLKGKSLRFTSDQ